MVERISPPEISENHGGMQAAAMGAPLNTTLAPYTRPVASRAARAPDAAAHTALSAVRQHEQLQFGTERRAFGKRVKAEPRMAEPERADQNRAPLLSRPLPDDHWIP